GISEVVLRVRGGPRLLGVRDLHWAPLRRSLPLFLRRRFGLRRRGVTLGLRPRLRFQRRLGRANRHQARLAPRQLGRQFIAPAPPAVLRVFGRVDPLPFLQQLPHFLPHPPFPPPPPSLPHPF